MAIEANFLGLAVEPAGNAFNSITTLNSEKAAKINPFVEEYVWENLIVGHIRNFLDKNGKEKPMEICDIGCGFGVTLERICREIKSRSGLLQATAIDLMPDNISSARKKLQELGVDVSRISKGDVTKKFPSGNFDLIIASQLIHWLKPEEVGKLFQNVADSMNNNGVFIISYATRLNNACLRDKEGKLDLERGKRSSAAGNPIHIFSHSSGEEMTFFSKEDLLKLAEENGLKGGFYLETDNLYYPTRNELLRTYKSQKFINSRENAYMAFGKK